MSRAELRWDRTEAVGADAQGPWVGDPRIGRARGTPTHRVAVDPHAPVDEPGAVGQAAQAAADVAVPLSLRERPVRGQPLSEGGTHRAATEDACSRDVRPCALRARPSPGPGDPGLHDPTPHVLLSRQGLGTRVCSLSCAPRHSRHPSSLPTRLQPGVPRPSPALATTWSRGVGRAGLPPGGERTSGGHPASLASAGACPTSRPLG